MLGGPSMRVPTHMPGQGRFAQVPSAAIERSTFDRSHGHKTTFNAAYLIPVYVDEALPGDTFNMQMTAFTRLTTPIKPIMDNLYMDSFFFAVPIRLIWSHWQLFNGEQNNPGDSTSYVVPQFSAHTPAFLSLSDYMGIPTTGMLGGNTSSYNSLWHRAYNLIYNQWFRDENLIASVSVDQGDGPDNIANYVLLKRGKRHDYFTSCLPWPQKGLPVTLPLAGYANVIPDPLDSAVRFGNAGLVNTSSVQNAGGAPSVLSTSSTLGAGVTQVFWGKTIGNPATVGLVADMTNITAASINSLRQAFQIQKLFERDARGGTRYIEIIRSHFGVVSPDARMQRSEYLGGSSSPIVISPIAQTSGSSITGQTTAQGNLAAMGTGVLGRGHGFTKSFTEHCVLIGLVSVRADLTYQQGLNRMFSRQTRYDFYWPALAHIGEQAVLNRELYQQGNANDVLVFGYQERYGEYRYKPSLVTGAFNSLYSTPLDVWHLAQKFTALPLLNQAFIEENPPINRIVAVTSEPQFYFDAFFKLICARPMPVFGVPGFVDHF